MDESRDELYRMINKFLSERCAVIYAVEAEAVGIPKNQLGNHVYLKMKRSGLVENIEDFIQTGALRIEDVREIYSHNIISNTPLMLQKWASIIKDAKKRGFKKVAVISGGTTMFLNNKNELVDYEQAILQAAKRIKSVHVICCYQQELLDKVSFSQLASIVNAHQCNVTSVKAGIESRKIVSSLLLDAIVDGIEGVMGKGSGELVMRTMKMVYRINEEIIISNPSVFQEKLQKILGNTSKIVLDSVSSRIREIMLLLGVIVMTHYTLYSTIVV